VSKNNKLKKPINFRKMITLISLLSILLLSQNPPSSVASNLRASPIDIPALSLHKEIVSTTCHPPDSCQTKVENGAIEHTEGELPSNVVHTTTTKCKGINCVTDTVTKSTAQLKKIALKKRLMELEHLVHKKEETDRANATLTSIKKEAKNAVSKYYATLIRSAAQEIRERSSPEQMVLANISNLLVALTVNNTKVPISIPEPTIAVVKDENIDLTKLILPDIEKDDPPTLEDRVASMEKYVTKKLHARMDAVEKKMAANTNIMTNDQKKGKIKQLNIEIKKELLKKIDQMEKKKRKEMLVKVKGLQRSIDNGGIEEAKDESGAGASDSGDSKSNDEAETSSSPSGPNGDDEKVLDGNNGEKLYKLSGDEQEEGKDDDDDVNGGGCNDGTDPSLIQLPPCSMSGDNGPNDLYNPSMYEGGPPSVSALQPQKFYKVKEVEAGSIDAADIITTDLDDPPPKTQPTEHIPLSNILEGSNAPKLNVVATGEAESALAFE
jgi:hypothetical protein